MCLHSQWLGLRKTEHTLQVHSQLVRKGIGPEICDRLLDEIGDRESELTAAHIFARRRRIGPHRAQLEPSRENRERDLAALGRAGFPPEVALSVIDAPNEG